MSPLRVSGGEARGRRLKAPKNIRPTQGIVKQAIFNIVASQIEDARVLDLFAGSGAIGIEPLSRGAASHYRRYSPRVGGGARAHA